MLFFGNALITVSLLIMAGAVSLAVEDAVDQATDRAERVIRPQLAWQGLAVANTDCDPEVGPQLASKPGGLVRMRQSTIASWSVVSSPSNLVVGWIFSIRRQCRGLTRPLPGLRQRSCSSVTGRQPEVDGVLDVLGELHDQERGEMGNAMLAFLVGPVYQATIRGCRHRLCRWHLHCPPGAPRRSS